MKISMIFVLFPIGIYGVGIQKLFEIKKWDNCPIKKKIDVYVEVNLSVKVPNKIFYSGYLDVKEKVPGPIEISFETNKCDFSMEKCESSNVFKVPGICGLLKNRNGPFSVVVEAFTPRLNCPIAVGRYNSSSSVIDVSPFTPLPIDGYIWLSTIKASSGEGKNKNLAMCIMLETKISMYKQNKKGKK